MFFILRHFTRQSTIGYRSRVSYRRSNHYNIIYLYTAGGHTNTSIPARGNGVGKRINHPPQTIISSVLPSTRLSFTSRLRRPFAAFFCPSPPTALRSIRLSPECLFQSYTHSSWLVYILRGDYFLKKHSIRLRGGFTRDKQRWWCSSPFRDWNRNPADYGLLTAR